MNKLPGITKNTLKDIRFWILLSFIIRIYGIWNPPLEVQHNWRQTTVNMVARNFLEVDNNILYPRLDFAGGDKTGITGMEFPILNYSIYLVSEAVGFDHWYGRLINLIVSSIGIWYFFRLLQTHFSEELAWYSSFLLIFSEWFMFSRKIMPDTFSLSLVIIGLFYGLQYLIKNKHWKNLLLYFILITTGILSKLPSGFLLIVLLIPLFSDKVPVNRKLLFYGLSLVAVIPSVWWYFIWVPHLVETYGFWHFYMGMGLREGFHELVNHWDLTLMRFYKSAMGFSGFIIYLAGIFYIFQKRNQLLIWTSTLLCLGFIPIMLKSGFAFHHHNYYILPFVPVMCIIGAWTITHVPKKIAIAVLCVFALEGFLTQMRDLSVRDKYRWPETLEAELDEVIPEDAIIVMNTPKCPTQFYFTHRKGWLSSNKDLESDEFLEEIKTKGCQYAIILKDERKFAPKKAWKQLYSTPNYSLYDIR